MNSSHATITAESLFKQNQGIFVNRALEDFEIPLHSHDFVEFAFIAEGTGFHHLEDEVYPVHKGQLFVIPVGIPHVFRPASANSHKNPLIVYNCVFTSETISRLSGLFADEVITARLTGLAADSTLPYNVYDKEGVLEKLFIRLHQEYSLQLAGSFAYLYSLLLQLVIETYRLQQGNPSPQEQQAGSPLFQQVLQYVEKHYSGDITLTDLAAMCQWSERQLQRLFKQHTGQTFRSYLQNVRIRQSCEALRTTDHKISVIADNVGYKDMDSFIDVFKRIVGKSPKEFRRQLHGNVK